MIIFLELFEPKADSFCPSHFVVISIPKRQPFSVQSPPPPQPPFIEWQFLSSHDVAKPLHDEFDLVA
uniref:Uncharacterized protein n=1 Tax=Romanomermis culicivorax TaxID=13658 RepID=A0A915HIV1_ROMCU